MAAIFWGYTKGWWEGSWSARLRGQAKTKLFHDRNAWTTNSKKKCSQHKKKTQSWKRVRLYTAGTNRHCAKAKARLIRPFTNFWVLSNKPVFSYFAIHKRNQSHEKKNARALRSFKSYNAIYRKKTCYCCKPGFGGSRGEDLVARRVFKSSSLQCTFQIIPRNAR